MHPANVLFKGETLPRVLPVCDHYCGTEARMRKALELQSELGPVFDITFDCEDGAPIGKEVEHANMCANLINSDENKFNRVGARIHDPLHSHLKSDIEILINLSGSRIAFITIPKVDSALQVIEIIKLINAQAANSKINRIIPIQVLIETHQALEDVFAIAAIPQIECLSFGLMDFVSAHNGAIPSDAMSKDQFRHPLVVRAMVDIAAACHRYGKIPSHNVCTNINDPEVIRSDSFQAKNLMGYTRKWSIHPNQISHIVEIFSPSDADCDEAVTILLKASDADWGPIQNDGKLHDRASYRYYWSVLEKALAAGKRFPQISAKGWL
jgi:citrate lyase subunit beta/citryl-CoA lyase